MFVDDDFWFQLLENNRQIHKWNWQMILSTKAWIQSSFDNPDDFAKSDFPSRFHLRLYAGYRVHRQRDQPWRTIVLHGFCHTDCPSVEICSGRRPSSQEDLRGSESSHYCRQCSKKVAAVASYYCAAPGFYRGIPWLRLKAWRMWTKKLFPAQQLLPFLSFYSPFCQV